MSRNWTEDDLRRIGAATELQIVGSVTGPHAAPVTLHLVPQAAA